MKKENRRKQKRRIEENKVEIELLSDKKNSPSQTQSFAFTKDISLDGVKIQSDAFFPVDSLLRMKVTLSQSRKTLVMRGRVKWVRERPNDVYELGVEFEKDMPDEFITLISHLYGVSKKNSH